MKVIVTTTINPITKALEKFIAKADWKMIVVGDLKTPHKEYENVSEIKYLHPDEQEIRWPELSKLIGFKCIQRRNFGFLAAYEMGADIIATIDDDNIPYDNWGDDLLVNQTVEVDCYYSYNSVFDPLSVTNHKNLWHRGYPWELIKTKNDISYVGKRKITVDVQAGLWDGDPDIDAVERMIYKPMVKFDHFEPFTLDKSLDKLKLTVFNSQNTFISRRVLPYYMMIPFVGRMDDIWGSYIVQRLADANVVFSKASVFQERNTQNLFVNMDNEMMGYRNNHDFVSSMTPCEKLPKDSLKAFELYQSLFV